MIHYHGTPCGGPRQDVARFLAGRHALIPWSRPEDVSVAAEVCQSFCLDNGAFSAWQSGAPIADWSGYYQFVLTWARHPAFDFAIIPDVIEGTEEDNDRLLVEWEKNIHRARNRGAPVWHLHESLGRLRNLCYHWPRVCLGSSGAYANPQTEKWWDRIGQAMAVACDQNGNPMAKLHGLRMLDPAIFTAIPLASADSTNAARNSSSFSRFGMYPPPTTAQRMAVIADRIEAHNSPAIWMTGPEQPCLVLTYPNKDGR